MDSKPELQRVLEHRRWNQLIKKKEEELEAKRLQCPFRQELLRRQQRLNQVGRRPSLQSKLLQAPREGRHGARNLPLACCVSLVWWLHFSGPVFLLDLTIICLRADTICILEVGSSVPE